MAKPNDFVVDNASGADVRTDLNNLFDAISINNGFGTVPTTKYKYMWYADESSGKMSFYKANAQDKLDFISLTDGSFFGPNGSASNPSYTFTNSTSTGFYRSASNEIGVSNGGANTALFKSTGTDIKGVLSVAPTSGEAYIQVQTNGINNEDAYIDFVADTTYTDYGLRLLRGDQGANSVSQLVHRGTGNFQIETTEAASLLFRTSNTDRWKVNSSGAFIWTGHTGSLGSNVGLTGDILPRGIISKAGGTAGAVTSNNLYNFYWTGSALECWIDGAKEFTVAATSDYRVKKDITNLTDIGIDKIKQLRPVNYEFKDNTAFSFKGDGVQRVGFIANEVAEVIPSAVDGEKDATNKLQSLRVDAIVSVLTKALQEAVAKIETLETKVAALEGS